MHIKPLEVGQNQKLGRVCSKCGSDKTYIKIHKNGRGYENWYRIQNGVGFLCKRCHQHETRIVTLWQRRAKEEAFIQYFGKSYKCTRCNINDIRVLTLHHPNGDGAKYRLETFGKKIKGTGTPFYSWLKSHGFPKLGLEPYCANCHIIIEIEKSDKKYV